MVSGSAAIAELLLSGFASGTANAERRPSGPPFCLWARMHLAEAITKAFMLLRSKASKDRGEIYGDIKSRERKPICDRRFVIKKKVFEGVREHGVMVQVAVLLGL